MRRASLLLLAALGWAGCGGARPQASLDTAAQSYRAGEPGFVLDALATVRNDTTGVDLYLGVARPSLVFRQSGDGLEAIARWTVTVGLLGEPGRVLAPVDTLRADFASETRRPEPVWRRLRVDLPPGRYRVQAILEDRASERTAERTALVDVFAVDARPALGEVRLVGQGDEPVDPASVPAGLDSLRAVVQATAVPDGSTTVLRVVRLRSDQDPAAPPTAFTPQPGTLVRRGVDPAEVDTVQTVRQTVLNPAGVLDVEAPLPALGPGVYAVSLDLMAPDGAALDTAERIVVVRRRDYPALTRLGDLVAPLVYLGDARELARITDAPAGARQQAFDRFWGERLDDRRLAAATVRAYYDRVEEANRRFATYKAGWKTDPGMIYILFGPPSYVEATLEGERWIYGQGSSAPPVLTFERTAGRAGETGLFTVFTLVRDRAYSEAWLRARRQWRSGVVP